MPPKTDGTAHRPGSLSPVPRSRPAPNPFGSVIPSILRYTRTRTGLLLLALRLVWALWMPSSDCDETYNYYEPLHYLLYRSGKQTWEYSSEFSLRGYFYLWMYGIVGQLFESITSAGYSKVCTYYAIRIGIAFVSVLCDLFFIGGVKMRFGRAVAMVAYMSVAFAPGEAKAAVSFLPSSFAMSWYFLVAGGWLRFTAPSQSLSRANAARIVAYKRQCLAVTVLGVVFATVVGWPFAALIGVPIALHLLFTSKAIVHLFIMLILFTATLVAIVATFDAYYYCQWVFSTWNIVKYNVFSSSDGRSSELYGVEPWTFFFKNLLLNYNLAFIFALATFPLAVAGIVIDAILGKKVRTNLGTRFSSAQLVTPQSMILFSTPFYLWFVFWMRIPHKEERFFAPCYPFLTLSGAMSCYYFAKKISDVISPGDWNIIPREDLTPQALLLKKKKPEEKGDVNPSGQTPSKSKAKNEELDVSPEQAAPTPQRGSGPGSSMIHRGGKQPTSPARQRSGPEPEKDSSNIAVSPPLKVIRLGPKLGSLLLHACVLLVMIVGLSRSIGEVYFYSGYEKAIYRHFSWREDGTFERRSAVTAALEAQLGVTKESAGTSRKLMVCLGRDWYRFPTAFFLPRYSFDYGFLKTDAFSGALPKPFRYEEYGTNCTCVPNKNMNDLNQETPDQYTAVEDCDFLVDVVPSHKLGEVGRFSTDAIREAEEVLSNEFSTKDAVFEAIGDEPLPLRILDPSATTTLCRMGYVPFYTEFCARWSPVVVLRNRRVKNAGVAGLYKNSV